MYQMRVESYDFEKARRDQPCSDFFFYAAERTNPPGFELTAWKWCTTLCLKWRNSSAAQKELDDQQV